MISKLATTCSKLLFCFRISANANTLFKLLYNTKLLRWNKKSNKHSDSLENATVYLLKINGRNHPVFLRTFQGDIDIFYEIFWRRIYELPQHTMQECKVIVDIGANVGMAALYFATHYASAKIICIEPDEDNYFLLQKNCASHENIKTMQAAVMAKDGWCLVKKAVLQYNNSVAFTNSLHNSVQAISMPTLFAIFHLSHIDLLKMDIEGAEDAIFSKHTNWLDEVSQLLVEIHAPEKSNASFAALQKHGFTVTAVNPNEFSESVYWAVSNQGVDNNG